jgi:hypothetical protein
MPIWPAIEDRLMIEPEPVIPEDLSRHNCIVYTELAMRNAWSFTAGLGAPDPVA